MKTRILLAAALAAASGFSPALAGLNDPPAAAEKRAAVGDLGMATMSAVINADGTVLRGEGVVSSLKLGTGVYEVVFGRDITACAYFVTAGEGGVGGANPAQVAVTQRAGDAAAVFLRIKAPGTDTLADNGFFVLVFCGR